MTPFKKAQILVLVVAIVVLFGCQSGNKSNDSNTKKPFIVSIDTARVSDSYRTVIRNYKLKVIQDRINDSMYHALTGKLNAMCSKLIDSIITQKGIITIDTSIDDEYWSDGDHKYTGNDTIYSTVCHMKKGTFKYFEVYHESNPSYRHNYLKLYKKTICLDKVVATVNGQYTDSMWRYTLTLGGRGSSKTILFHGRKYTLLKAGPDQCNGTGCMTEYYFIYDYLHDKLSVYESDGSKCYFGDINHDGNLDFLVEDITFPKEGSPYYCLEPHLKDTFTLSAYSIDSKGELNKMKDKGKDCFLEYVINSTAPYSPRLVKKHWYN